MLERFGSKWFIFLFQLSDPTLVNALLTLTLSLLSDLAADQHQHPHPVLQLLLSGTSFAGLGFYVLVAPSLNTELHVYGNSRSLVISQGDFLKKKLSY